LTSRFKCYLDRFESDVAVLILEGKELVVSSALLPDGAVEGDHLEISIDVDRDARSSTASEISDLQERLSSEDES